MLVENKQQRQLLLATPMTIGTREILAKKKTKHGDYKIQSTKMARNIGASSKGNRRRDNRIFFPWYRRFGTLP